MPQGNGASFVSDQPDTPYYRVAGQRPADPRYPGTPARSDRDYSDRDYADRDYADRDYAGRDYQGRRRNPNNPNPNNPNQAFYRDSSLDRPADGSRAGAGRSRVQPERGLPSWLALLLLIGIAGVCGLIDSLSGSAIRGAFNYGLVAASLVAILVVKRSGMFPIVVAPPLVYFVASAALLYIRTGGLHDRGKLIDAATNWIVYGFPAIAGATAVVLVVAGIRLVTRR